MAYGGTCSSNVGCGRIRSTLVLARLWYCSAMMNRRP